MFPKLLIRRLEELVPDVRYSYKASYALIGEKNEHRTRYFHNYDELCDFVKANEANFVTLRVELNYSEILLKYDKEVTDVSEQQCSVCCSTERSDSFFA